MAELDGWGWGGGGVGGGVCGRVGRVWGVFANQRWMLDGSLQQVRSA